jgi:hypothetical protein
VKLYKKDKIKLQHNNKTGEVGTIDVLRGCCGCECSKICYASKGARMTGINFFSPVKRIFDKKLLERQLSKYNLDWVRIGCISDPSLDWETTCEIVKLVRAYNKTPVVITKAHNYPTDTNLTTLAECDVNLQISVCGMTPRKKVFARQILMRDAFMDSINVSWRINSAAWKPDSKPARVHEILIAMAKVFNVPIIDTPIRLFKTSPFWKHVDQTKYHRHLSPISGKLDNQRTAGLIIPEALPCYSTCSPKPTIPPYGNGHDEFGCPHQCNTIVCE